MVIFYKKWKNYNEIQLTKNKMDLNIRKMTNHPPSPVSECNFLKSNSLVIQECCPQYSHKGTGRMIQDKEPKEPREQGKNEYKKRAQNKLVPKAKL